MNIDINYRKNEKHNVFYQITTNAFHVYLPPIAIGDMVFQDANGNIIAFLLKQPYLHVVWITKSTLYN